MGTDGPGELAAADLQGRNDMIEPGTYLVTYEPFHALGTTVTRTGQVLPDGTQKVRSDFDPDHWFRPVLPFAQVQGFKWRKVD